MAYRDSLGDTFACRTKRPEITTPRGTKQRGLCGYGANPDDALHEAIYVHDRYSETWERVHDAQPGDEIANENYDGTYTAHPIGRATAQLALPGVLR